MADELEGRRLKRSLKSFKAQDSFMNTSVVKTVIIREKVSNDAN